jgi:hypothetical protein
MATAKRIKSDPLPPPPDKIQLTLSLPEANTLKALTGSVIGGMDTPRKHTDAIYDALHQAGVDELFHLVVRNIEFVPNALDKVESND